MLKHSKKACLLTFPSQRTSAFEFGQGEQRACSAIATRIVIAGITRDSDLTKAGRISNGTRALESGSSCGGHQDVASASILALLTSWRARILVLAIFANKVRRATAGKKEKNLLSYLIWLLRIHRRSLEFPWKILKIARLFSSTRSYSFKGTVYVFRCSRCYPIDNPETPEASDPSPIWHMATEGANIRGDLAVQSLKLEQEHDLHSKTTHKWPKGLKRWDVQSVRAPQFKSSQCKE